VIDKLAWVHIRDGRMLAARSRGRDVWFVPGGKRESGESDEQALMREIAEELTVTLDRDSLQFLHVFEAQAHGKPEGEFVRMTCFTADYSGQLQPSAELGDIASAAHADRDRMSLVTQNIADWLRDRGELQ